MSLLFIFRRDLRIVDNRALEECARAAKSLGGGAGATIIPAFVFDPRQDDAGTNSYYGPACFAFMLECLEDLKSRVPELMLVRGDDLAFVRSMVESKKVLGVYFNADLTPFALERDARIREYLREAGVPCVSPSDDYTLVDPVVRRERGEKYYQKFTPFYKRYLPEVVREVTRGGDPDDLEVRIRVRVQARRPKFSSFTLSHRSAAGIESNVDLPGLLERTLKKVPYARDQRGGRRLALIALENVRNLGEYDKTRDDIWDARGTSRLSAYLKFGAISVREVARAVIREHGEDHGLLRELLWRAFYYAIVYNVPHVLRGQVYSNSRVDTIKNKNKKKNDNKNWNLPLRLAYERVPWSTDENSEAFRRFCTGQTGFPLVDAGVRQLLTTAFMHNRLRMITSNFLVKSLMIDWRLGERFFAQNLADYDPASNSGGWQWSAGCGADSQPYFRTFSPWLQAKKHDPDAVYIKRYVPELANVPAKDVLAWDKACEKWSREVSYPRPMSHAPFNDVKNKYKLAVTNGESL